jgi:hypothetical protein
MDEKRNNKRGCLIEDGAGKKCMEYDGCPRCSSLSIELEVTEKGKCLDCGQEFVVKKVAIWRETDETDGS